MKGLYLHIPFCTIKCKFCDFAAFPGLLKQIPAYLDVLEKEMLLHAKQNIDTLYLGGGTPSILDTAQWQKLITALRRHFVWSTNLEFSVECNPETLDAQKCQMYADSGVNRISMGLQASQDFLLKALGRLHDYQTFLQALKQAKQAGLNNINVDLMFGLPGQNLQHWQDSLKRVADLDLQHISCYALHVEEKTQFHHQHFEPDDALQADMYLYASEFLRAQGFNHYEISNFARTGFECKHNLKYWRNQDCLGLGVGASAYLDNTRQKNTEKFADYMTRLASGQSVLVEQYRLDAAAQKGEDLMLLLRLSQGADFTPDVQQQFGSVVEKFLACGWMQLQHNRLSLTVQGWLFSNQIFMELI